HAERRRTWPYPAAAQACKAFSMRDEFLRGLLPAMFRSIRPGAASFFSPIAICAFVAACSSPHGGVVGVGGADGGVPADAGKQDGAPADQMRDTSATPDVPGTDGAEPPNGVVDSAVEGGEGGDAALDASST